MKSAHEFLHDAAAIQEQRGVDYDKPSGERSMARTVAMFNACVGRDLSEAEGWLFMDCLKSVRMFTNPGYHADSCLDKVSYAALLAECKSK